MDIHSEHTPNESEEGSFLSKVPKESSVFHTPEGYFDTVGKVIMDRIEEEEYLAREAPGLSKISRESIFIVPEAYWRQFTENLKQKLDDTSNPFLGLSTVKNNTLVKRISYGVAAAIAMILLGVWFRTYQQTAIPLQAAGLDVALASISTEALMWEINDKEFSDTEKIAKLLEQEGIGEGEIGYIPQEWVTKEEMDLLLNQIDISDIKEEWFE